MLGPKTISEYEKPSLIDNVFDNFSDIHCTSGNIIEKISDQLPFFLIVKNLISV